MTLWRSILLFTVLTAVMTWPQAAHLGTEAADHQDVYFNMWRVGWFAHALATAPSHLLDGNIFYPEPRALTFSDAMPVESLVGAPLLWSGLPPVLVHNLLLLGAIVLSGAGACVLAGRLTGSAAAGVTAGIVFAFAPYRFEHYMHLELQWTVWTPWAFWALQRTFETGARRFGAMAGAAVTLQMLSSVYYGIFLAVALALCALLLLVSERQRFRAVVVSLSLGAAVAGAACAAYAVPYLSTKQEVGGRNPAEIVEFSAKPSSYTVATPGNFLYGRRNAPRGRAERRLFPGVLPCLLAVFGLLARRPTPAAIMYVLALGFAFEMSLGFYGYSYRFLYDHVPAFEGLRAPARLGIFVMFFLAVLAAYGHAVLEQVVPPAFRRIAAVGIAAVLLLEYWVAPLALVPYPNAAPPLYAWLAHQPRGLVLELPAPHPDTLPGEDPRYSYMSTFHWMPLVNGYSGFYPASYASRLEALRGFPDDRALRQMRADGVRYVIVHAAGYPPDALERIRTFLAAAPAAELGSFNDGRADATVFALR